MANIQLDLEQALKLANREDAPAGVRIIGALSAGSVWKPSKPSQRMC